MAEGNKPDTMSLEEAVKPLDCAKQILEVAAKFPESKPNLLVIAQLFTKQLTAAASKSSASTGGLVKQKIEPGTGWCLLPRQSFQTPRGQFDVEFLTDGGIYLHSKSVTHTLKPGNVESIVELKTADKYTSGSASKTQLLLVLKEPLAVNKSRYACLLCTPSVENKSKLLSVSLFKAPPNGAIEAVDDVAQGGAMEMWTTVLSHMSAPIPLTRPDGQAFKSSTSGPYVKCYCNNVNNGMLFPTQLGVIFIQKPLVYVPLDQIDRIELGRGGAVSGRTFDLNLYCKDKSVHHFSMIEKDELTPLATYVSETKANEQASGGSADEEGAENEEGDSDGSGEDSAYSEDESLSSASDESDDIDSEDIDLDADGPVDEKIERRTTRAMKKVPAAANIIPKPKPVKQESQVVRQRATAVSQQSASSSKRSPIVKAEVKPGPKKQKPEPAKRSLPVPSSSSVLKEENSSMPKVKKAKVAAPTNDNTDTESEGENVMCS